MEFNGEVYGSGGDQDERGLVSHKVPYIARSFSEIFRVGLGGYAGLPETARTWKHDAGGVYLVEVTYEGRQTTEVAKKELYTFSCKSSFREEAIEGHPQIEELIKKFKGSRDAQTQKVTFPASLTGAGTNGLSGEGGVADKPNPMAGVEKYMALEVVWSRKYVSDTIPKAIYARIGKITTSPPGYGAAQPPKIPKRQAWLIMPPQVTQRGNVFDVEEEYTLLPEGTPKEVYDLKGDGDK